MTWKSFFYRHERPSDPDDPLSEQNIRDRYYGNNDPVADKLMKRAKEMPALEPPEDPLITTLYVAGLTDDQSKSVVDPVSETDLRNHFYQVCNHFSKTFSMTILAVGISTKLCNFETHETNIFIYETS